MQDTLLRYHNRYLVALVGMVSVKVSPKMFSHWKRWLGFEEMIISSVQRGNNKVSRREMLLTIWNGVHSISWAVWMYMHKLSCCGVLLATLVSRLDIGSVRHVDPDEELQGEASHCILRPEVHFDLDLINHDAQVHLRWDERLIKT